jgi:hypothetical protein
MSTKPDTTTVDNRDPDVIRQEIHEATENLSETLDALQDKLQPEVLVAEAKEKALDGVYGVRDRVLSSARRHPAAATLVGLAALWLVGRSLIGSKAQVGGGIFSFALGAAVGIGAYRAVLAEQHLDDDDPEMLTGELEHDVNLPATHPTHVALE